MTLRAAFAAALLAHALPAAADFEGVADVRMSGEEQGGRMEGKGKLYLSPGGWRFELDMTAPRLGQETNAPKAAEGQEYRLVTFGKASTPRKAWMLNERTKTYTVIEDRDADAGERPDEEGWKVVRVGQETIAGFPCTNVKAQREGKGETWEACLAKDFTAGEWLKKSIKNEEGWFVAAKRLGVTGYPVRLVERAEGGAEKHRFEVVKVERRKVPASTFEVPGGYKEGTMMDVVVQTPEQRRQLEELHRQATEALKNMPPEQRKAMEEMMKKHGAGQKE